MYNSKMPANIVENLRVGIRVFLWPHPNLISKYVPPQKQDVVPHRSRAPQGLT